MSIMSSKLSEQMKTKKPKTIQEAIDDFQTYLECDLYSRFRPAHTLPIGKNGKDEIWYRNMEDVFKSEREFIDYLREHFKIFEKQIKELKINGYKKTKEELNKLKAWGRSY